MGNSIGRTDEQDRLALQPGKRDLVDGADAVDVGRAVARRGSRRCRPCAGRYAASPSSDRSASRASLRRRSNSQRSTFRDPCRYRRLLSRIRAVRAPRACSRDRTRWPRDSRSTLPMRARQPFFFSSSRDRHEIHRARQIDARAVKQSAACRPSFGLAGAIANPSLRCLKYPLELLQPCSSRRSFARTCSIAAVRTI